MATEIGTAYISIVPSFRGASKTLQGELDEAESSASKRGFGGKLFSGLKKTAVGAGIAVGGVLAGSIAKGFGRLTQIESAEAKLRGLGNSAEDVQAIMKNALAAVKGTAFGMDEAATTAASAVAAGIKPGKELESYLGLVGDAATIAGTSMSEMGGIFNKVATSGKVQGDVFAQLGDKGIPIVQLLADKMGVSAEEVYKLGSAGKISSADFLDAMSSMQGAALEGGNTTAGAFANMMAAFSRFGAAILKGVFPLIGPLFTGLTGWIDKATERVGPLSEAFGVKLKGAIEGVRGVFDLLKTGDFKGGIFGLEEDSPVIGALLTIRDAAINVGTALGNAFKGFDWGTLATAFSPLLTAFQSLAPVLLDVWKNLSPLALIFETLKPSLPIIGGLIVSLANSLGTLLSDALTAVLPAVTELVGALGPMLAEAMATIAPAIMQVVQAIVPAISTIVQALGPLLSTVIGALLPIVGEIMGAVGPLVAMLADALVPVFGVVADVVGQLVVALTPLIGSLVEMVGSILTPLLGLVMAILTPLIQLVGAILPPLVQILGAVLVPVVGVLSTALGWVADVIGAVLGVAITWLTGAINWLVGVVSAAIPVIVGWFTGTLVPALQSAWDAISAAAMWLWHGVIEPVWNGIKTAIAVVVAIVMTYIDAWVWIFQNVLAPVFQWLYNTIIAPVWAGIQIAIGAVVSWFQNTAWPIISTVINWVSTAFDVMKAAIGVAWAWVQNNIIGPVVSWFQNTAWPAISFVIDAMVRGFGIMRDKIGDAWAWVKDKIISPVVDWFQNTIKPIFDSTTKGIGDAFNTMKDAVGKAWDAIKSAAEKPIKFVVETIVRDGIVKNFNKIAGKFGVDKIDEKQFTVGFKSGGVLPGYTPGRDVHDFYSPTAGRLRLSGGEAIMRPEWTRAVGGAGAVAEMNRKARRGQAFASGGVFNGPSHAYKGGGILDWFGDVSGDALDYIKGGAKFVSDVVADPKGVFSKLAETLVAKVPGGGLLKDLATAVPTSIAKSIGDALFGGQQAAGAVEGSPPPAGGGARTFPNWQAQYNALRGVASGYGLVMTSNYRGGAKTAGGGYTSLHALGRAVDWSGPASGMSAFFDYLKANTSPTELLYSPKGAGQKNRSSGWHDTSGATKKNHYSHVHAGYALGGVLPFLHDNGGWHMPGELSVNQTQKPEAVLTDSQWRTMSVMAERNLSEPRGGDTFIAHGYTVEEVSRQWRADERKRAALHSRGR